MTKILLYSLFSTNTVFLRFFSMRSSNKNNLTFQRLKSQAKKSRAQTLDCLETFQPWLVPLILNCILLFIGRAKILDFVIDGIFFYQGFPCFKMHRKTWITSEFFINICMYFVTVLLKYKLNFTHDVETAIINKC